MDVVVEVTGVGKAFERHRNPLKAFARVMTGGAPKDPFWALDNVSLQLRRGQSLGVVGRNGSGKSTLLQLICGTLAPSAGRVTVSGRIAAMLELGAGFHPDFTGRENVLLSAGVYGLAEAEINRSIPAIEAFADIGAYFDRPVREYSSGMYARLAFAVCAHVDADVLVVDEILGVGDAAFQRKCHGFMAEFRKKGALLFVSHDPNAVLASCDQALWLERGRQAGFGSARTILTRYVESLEASVPTPGPHRRLQAVRANPDAPDLRPVGANLIDVGAFNRFCASHGTGHAKIMDCAFIDGEGRPVRRITGGTPVRLRMKVQVDRAFDSPIVGFMLRNAAGQNLFGDNTFATFHDTKIELAASSALDAELTFRMPLLPAGTYTLAPSILSGTQERHFHVNWLEDALVLTVTSDSVRHGRVGVRVLHATVSPVTSDCDATNSP